MQLEIKHLVENYHELIVVQEKIECAISLLTDVYRNRGKVLLCGNGGSAADCEHIAGELLKEFKVRRPIPVNVKNQLTEIGASEEFLSNIYGALPAISLASHVGFITAFNNDANADYVFAQQLFALGEQQDALLALSTSGNSKNVVNAAIMAKAKKIKVIGLTGENGGKLKEYCDVLINVPSRNTARIQEFHLPIYHTICECLERQFFVDNSEQGKEGGSDVCGDYGGR